MTELNAEHARRAIVEHTGRLAESAVAAGPDAAVPTVPEWTITDLVEHVGQSQHWVAEIIERCVTDPAQLPTEVVVAPTGPREWQAWLSESAQRVASACSDDAGAWFVERRPDGATWKPGARQADVTVTGPARSLLLTMTRRLPLTDREATDISVDGDTDLAQHWLDNTAHVSG
jgi:MDMPI C-terminal domain/Mycothiol maleylpyruvate isomerase N-terminal domain